jgi:hypothetical protein
LKNYSSLALQLVHDSIHSTTNETKHMQKTLNSASHKNAVTHPLLSLQQTMGNQVVGRLIRSGIIQAKLRVSDPNDAYEQEADRVAEQVLNNSSTPSEINAKLSMPNTERVGRKRSACDMKEMGKEKQLMSIGGRKSSSSTIAIQKSDNLANEVIAVSGGESSSLDTSTREFMETRFGFDFSIVRVHTGTQAAASARSVNSLAYTVGNDIVFGEAQYMPYTLQGKKLLAHELTHVVQQNSQSSYNNQSTAIYRQEDDGSTDEGVSMPQTDMDPLCEDLLTQILLRITELNERFWAIVNNVLGLPPSGPMSVGGHQQQFRNKQANLRSMLNQWNTNNCGPGLPADSWFWATRPAPSPTPQSTEYTPKDGTQITVQDVAKVGGAVVTTAVGLYIAYRVVRLLPSLLPPLWWTIPANVALP